MEGGRNERAIVEVVEVMAYVLLAQQNPPADEFGGLGKFQQNNRLS